jgi:penicillin-binding protein 1A
MEDATKKKIIKWFWILVTAPFALILFLLLLVWMFAKIPSFEELEHPDSKLATQVIAEDGEILTTFHIENRSFVTFDELS